jgi:NAD(P)-dependent dehydrogenase (short-subunit alcohol dehydrogenase family)
MPTAVITGASRGLGLALARELAAREWQLIVDARHGPALRDAVAGLSTAARITPLDGDVADPSHRQQVVEAVDEAGGLDLLVNNASILGPSPLPHLDRYPIAELERVFRVNVIAPLALIQALLGKLTSSGGSIINLTSDAATEPYEGWGGYGSSKAALEQVTRILAQEQPDLRVYTFDPGDMRTVMQQEAFPGEDISDRPEPETVVPALLKLVLGRLPSGHYRANDLASAAQEVGA